MALEHSALTGSALHEPRGAAVAVANRVYLSNGAGSGSWAKVPLATLEDTAKAFETQLIHVRDRKNSGVDGGTFTSGDWRTRTLNQIVTNEITGASLSSNAVTLPSGTYHIKVSVPGFRCGEHRCRVKANTTVELDGENASSTASDGLGTSRTTAEGRVVLLTGKDITIEHRCKDTRNTDGLGKNSGFASIDEIYSQMWIWKIA